MSWVRFEDTFCEHPKVIGLSDRAFRVFVNAVCYSNRNLTDGEISASAQRYLRSNRTITTELLKAGLWDLGKSPGNFQIHDYLRYQFSKEAIVAMRATQSQAGKQRSQTANRVGGRFAPATHQRGPGELHQLPTSPRTSHVPPKSLYIERPSTKSGPRQIGKAVDRVLEDAGTRSDA